MVRSVLGAIAVLQQKSFRGGLLSFVLSFVFSLVRSIPLGQARAGGGGQGKPPAD